MTYKLSQRAIAAINEIIYYTDDNFGEAQTADYLDGLYTSFEASNRPIIAHPLDQHKDE
ncbi:MAG: type II toxin-antitoxin system RelE/ParE family toxin [Pseudomonadota bacterium]